MRARLLAATGALLGLLAADAGAAVFTVTYKGTGEYRTTFRAHPPNPGGDDDRNVARDSSRQRWAIGFRKPLELPDCAQAPDACAAVTGLSGARGPTAMTGRVDHRHVDGLYPQLDRTVRCRLRARTGPRSVLMAELSVRYVPESQSFAITALNPLATTVLRFPFACPRQGDSIDRILDFYAMPGFSFAQGWGPDRWFASGEVLVPAARFTGASRVALRLAVTPAGTPPRRCARPNPAYERCRTGGSWSGVLTFTRRR